MGVAHLWGVSFASQSLRGDIICLLIPGGFLVIWQII